MEILLDNSAFSTLSCKRRFQATVLEGLTLAKPLYVLFGDAFHKVVEHLDKGCELPEAFNKGLEGDRSGVDKIALMQTINYFQSNVRQPPPIEIDWPLPDARDESHLKPPTLAVELKFRYLYGNFMSDDSAEPITVYLAGTIDKIFIDPETDTLVIQDYKTSATVGDGPIAKTIANYEMSFQLPFYTYALIKSGILPASYLEYITSRRYRTQYCMILYNTRPRSHKILVKPAFPDDFLYREVPLIINNRVSDAIKIARLKEMAPHDGLNIYKACENCDFRRPCLSMGTQSELDQLANYERRVYNPLNFR